MGKLNGDAYWPSQLAEKINRFLVETHRAKQPINLRMYDAVEEVRVIGVIERIDTETQQFMVDGEWFFISNIIEMGFAKDSQRHAR